MSGAAVGGAGAATAQPAFEKLKPVALLLVRQAIEHCTAVKSDLLNHQVMLLKYGKATLAKLHGKEPQNRIETLYEWHRIMRCMADSQRNIISTPSIGAGDAANRYITFRNTTDRTTSASNTRDYQALAIAYQAAALLYLEVADEPSKTTPDYQRNLQNLLELNCGAVRDKTSLQEFVLKMAEPLAKCF